MRTLMLYRSSDEQDNEKAREILHQIAGVVVIIETSSATTAFEKQGILLPALVEDTGRFGGGGRYGLESIQFFVENELLRKVGIP